MKTSLKFVIVAFTTIVLFGSCDDSSTTNNPIDYSKYYKLTTGNWWLEETWKSDAQWNQITWQSSDSTVVSGETMISGKLAKMILAYNPNFPGIIDTSYEYFENSRIFTFSDEIPLIKESSWIEVLDFNANSKTIFDTTVTDLYLDFDELEGLFTGSIKFSYVRASNKNIALKGNNYSAIVFDYTLIFSGSINVAEYGVNPIVITIKMNKYFVENIGTVQSLITSTTEFLSLSNTSYTKTILVDWHVQ